MTRIFPYFSFTAIALFLSFELYSIDLPDFTELAETHSPTVVNILSEKEFTEGESDDNSRENSPFFFEDPFRDFFERRPNKKNRRPGFDKLKV